MSTTVIESDGGPFIILPEEVATEWTGVSGNDYERVCNDLQRETLVGGADFIGTIAVDSTHALAIAGGALVAFLRDGDDGLLVRAGDLTPDATRSAAAEAKWQSVPHTLVLPSGRFVVFDSARTLENADGVLRCELAPGTYAVEGVETQIAGEWNTLYRLRAKH